jgi:argininosuccinate lyase
MPQKRNADPMELVRGKTGRLIGHLAGLLTTLKGLPSSYNKDLQEDKEALFDAVDTVCKFMPVTTAIIRTLQVNPDKMRAALAEEMLSTELADYLVKKGLPFRQAHHIVGQVVQVAQEQDITLSQIPLEKLRELSDLFDGDVMAVFDFDAAVARRIAPGGTAPDAVKAQIAAAKQWMESHQAT